MTNNTTSIYNMTPNKMQSLVSIQLDLQIAYKERDRLEDLLIDTPTPDGAFDADAVDELNDLDTYISRLEHILADSATDLSMVEDLAKLVLNAVDSHNELHF